MANFVVMMHNDSHLTPLLGMTLEGLQAVAAEAGLPRYAAGQIARRLYQHRATTIDEMTELSRAARSRLKERYTVGRHAPIAEALSADGTGKYLFRGVGGCDIESVFIPDRDRATICVSSQAGCKMGCRFCMTGRRGFHGQLSAADIIKIAMVRVARDIAEAGLASRMIMQVHDELIFNVKPDELDRLREIVVRDMADAYHGLVPLEVACGVASNWLDAH